jgi:hypothetical protein
MEAGGGTGAATGVAETVCVALEAAAPWPAMRDGDGVPRPTRAARTIRIRCTKDLLFPT